MFLNLISDRVSLTNYLQSTISTATIIYFVPYFTRSIISTSFTLGTNNKPGITNKKLKMTGTCDHRKKTENQNLILFTRRSKSSRNNLTLKSKVRGSVPQSDLLSYETFSLLL